MSSVSWGSRLVHRLAGRAAYGPVVLAEPGRPGRRATQRWGIVQLLGSAVVIGFIVYRTVAHPRPVAPLAVGVGVDDEDLACPLRYDRLTVQEVEKGAKPYLLGGDQQPACSNCKRKDEWAQICRFKAGQLCPAGAMQRIVQTWLDRQFHMPLTMTPCDLWKYLDNRTFYLLGDSMMLDFYKALKCFMYEFWDDLQHHPVVDDPQLQQDITWDTAVPPDCVHLLGNNNTRICYIRLDRGYDMTNIALPIFQRFMHPTDRLIVNFGLHHWHDYEETLRNFTTYVARHRDQLPRVLWQQTSQQHFKNEEGSGEYPGGQPPFECLPIANFTVANQGSIFQLENTTNSFHILTGNWRNTVADPSMRRARIAIIPSYNESLWMWNMHRDNGGGMECTHFCHPSVPQTWVLNLYRAMRWNKFYP